ncbi:MFS transporter [Acinetobacter sp. S40]|uniref:MFS transporter n=1 Tax=Acinetobacter sp. S40 TaxID=2767434 RepID=UPI00190E42BD|nr:MFS transporter [Acinetobacter sp. S40]MBJ9984657.1 MFS transporter [Acinetobacter sp. S40]
MHPVVTQRLWNRCFILCILNNLFLFIYYYALLTVLPLYILKELSGSVSQAGLALTLFLISSILTRPFSGLIIERLGKKYALRGTAVLFVLFAFTYLWADQLWVLLGVRFMHGIWFSILTTVTVPVVNDFIPEQRKGEGMGYFVMSTNLAVVLGPLFALTAIQYISFYQLFVLLSFIICLGLIFCFFIPVSSGPKAEIQNTLNQITLQDIFEKNVIPVGMVALFTAISYSSIMSFISVYSETKGLLAATSLFFMIFALSMMIVRPWIGHSYDLRGPNSVVYPSFICFSIGLFLIGCMQSQWIYWLAAVFIGIGYGSLFPIFQTMAIQSVEKQRIGHAVSTFFTLFDLGMAIGSVVMGLLIARIGYEMTYQFCGWMVLGTLLLYRLICHQSRQAFVRD